MKNDHDHCYVALMQAPGHRVFTIVPHDWPDEEHQWEENKRRPGSNPTKSPCEINPHALLVPANSIWRAGTAAHDHPGGPRERAQAGQAPANAAPQAAADPEPPDRALQHQSRADHDARDLHRVGNLA